MQKLRTIQYVASNNIMQGSNLQFRHVRGEHQEQVWTVLQSENSVTYTGEAGALQELLQTVRLWQLRRQRAVRSLNRDNNYVSASQESSPLNRAKVKLR